MSEEVPFDPIAREQIERLREAEKPSYPLRWWVLLLAVLLCLFQTALDMLVDFKSPYERLDITTSYMPSFAVFLFLIILLIANPLLRLIRLVRPFNRAELLALFVALFVTAGIGNHGFVGTVAPQIAWPYNPQWNTPQSGHAKYVVPYLKKELYLTDPERIAEYRAGFQLEGPREKQFWPRVKQETGRLKMVWSRIHWTAWLRPIALWAIFGAGVYLMFYALSLLLFDFWARRERLVFPVAQIPEAMVPEEGSGPGWISSTLRDKGFQTAFLIVFLLIGYDKVVSFDWLPGLNPIGLGRDGFGIKQDDLRALLLNSPFKGIADLYFWKVNSSGLSLNVRFAVVGIAFLLPAGIACSIWVYHLILVGLIMGAIWLGFGSSAFTFPTDTFWENNFVNSIGSGAFLAFALICLWKVFHDRWKTTRESPPSGGRMTLGKLLAGVVGGSGALFLVGVAMATAWLCWSGAGLGWAIAFMAVSAVTTVGLMGLVAETGAPQVYLSTGPFHLVRTTGIANAVPALTMAALSMGYGAFFYFVNFSIAPALINALKIKSEMHSSSRKYHLLVALSVVAVVVFGFGLYVFLTHVFGANYANGVRIDGWPGDLANQAENRIEYAVGDADLLALERGKWNWVFYLIGAGWFVLSLALRRRVFWWLHPIGLALQCNAAMVTLWFGFFIGWLCKKLAVSYGGRHLFARVRPFFIGLIVAELASFCFWNLIGFCGAGME